MTANLPAGSRRAVMLVDLDDTLIADRPAAHAALAATLAGQGLPHDGTAISTVLSCAERCWAAQRYRRYGSLTYVSSWEALWLPTAGTGLPGNVAAAIAAYPHHMWRTALGLLGGDPRRAGAAAEAFRTHRRALLALLPGVPAALDALSERHVLWLATNGLPAHQLDKINAVGLNSRFNRIIVSGQVGAAKNEPRFAAHLSAALTAGNRHVCLVIGDSIVHDLGLARHGGWPAAHLCVPGRCPARQQSTASDATPVWHTTDLAATVAYCTCPACPASFAGQDRVALPAPPGAVVGGTVPRAEERSSTVSTENAGSTAAYRSLRQIYTALTRSTWASTGCGSDVGSERPRLVAPAAMSPAVPQ